MTDTTQHRLDPGTRTPAIEVVGISKAYGATQALDDVSVSIAEGEIRGLVGRNGAGKSTLVRTITGLEVPDAGTVRFFGDTAPPLSATGDWQRLVACVYQRPSVFTNMSVAENMYVNRYPNAAGRPISWKEMRTRSEAVLEEWGVRVDPTRVLGDIPLEQRQMVQIARALDSGTRIVLLDEPTVQLDGHAIARLFDKVSELKTRGVSFVLVSHFLREISDVCDSATVLRDGRLLWTRPTRETSQEDLLEAMLAGQEKQISQIASLRAETPDTPPRMSVAGLADRAGAFTDISFSVGPGELVAIAGLAGSGKNELGEMIAGLSRPAAGVIRVDGRPVRTGSVPAAQRAGIGFVPADRHKAGFVPALSVAENMTMTTTGTATRFGFFSPRRQRELSRRLIDQVTLVPPNPDLRVSGLSGGNQQKVVLARALATDPTVLVLVSPTAGVDISAKDTIYALIRDAVSRGVSVVLISDDVEELLISPRVLVMLQGRLTQTLLAPEEEHVVRAMEGMTNA